MQSTSIPKRTISRSLAKAIVHSPPPLVHISVQSSTSQGACKQHSSRSCDKHITCEKKPRISFPVRLECSDWGRIILTSQQQRRRRRQSLIVVDSNACKEAHRFCDAQYFHDVLEEYSDMEKPSFDRQVPPTDAEFNSTDLTLKELAGRVLQLCSIWKSQHWYFSSQKYNSLSCNCGCYAFLFSICIGCRTVNMKTQRFQTTGKLQWRITHVELRVPLTPKLTKKEKGHDPWFIETNLGLFYLLYFLKKSRKTYLLK